MNKPEKIMAFLHWDLDGVVCYFMLRWTFPNANIEYIPTTVTGFRLNYMKWLFNHNIDDYDVVFIMDLSVFNDKDIIDNKKVFIIDHHASDDTYVYKHARVAIKPEGSACMLAYKIFKDFYKIKLTKPQLHLLVLADDFDSYTLKYKDSYNLNIVFWDTTNKFESFVESFSKGFNGFSKQQQAIIRIHNRNVQKFKDEMVVYAGTIYIQDGNRYVCSTFAKHYINEVADTLINTYNADIALVINTNTNHVSYRKNNDKCNVNLSTLAANLAVGGGGHEFSSGSEITEDFMEFIKPLKKLDI